MGKAISIYLDTETLKRIEEIQKESNERSRSFIIKELLNEAIQEKIKQEEIK